MCVEYVGYGSGLLRNRILKNSESEVKFEILVRSESESELRFSRGRSRNRSRSLDSREVGVGIGTSKAKNRRNLRSRSRNFRNSPDMGVYSIFSRSNFLRTYRFDRKYPKIIESFWAGEFYWRVRHTFNNNLAITAMPKNTENKDRYKIIQNDARTRLLVKEANERAIHCPSIKCTEFT